MCAEPPSSERDNTRLRLTQHMFWARGVEKLSLFMMEQGDVAATSLRVMREITAEMAKLPAVLSLR